MLPSLKRLLHNGTRKAEVEVTDAVGQCLPSPNKAIDARQCKVLSEVKRDKHKRQRDTKSPVKYCR